MTERQSFTDSVVTLGCVLAAGFVAGILYEQITVWEGDVSL